MLEMAGRAAIRIREIYLHQVSLMKLVCIVGQIQVQPLRCDLERMVLRYPEDQARKGQTLD
jgi:hypothetical protein